VSRAQTVDDIAAAFNVVNCIVRENPRFKLGALDRAFGKKFVKLFDRAFPRFFRVLQNSPRP
jgi:hypothetical protein